MTMASGQEAGEYGEDVFGFSEKVNNSESVLQDLGRGWDDGEGGGDLGGDLGEFEDVEDIPVDLLPGGSSNLERSMSVLEGSSTSQEQTEHQSDSSSDDRKGSSHSPDTSREDAVEEEESVAQVVTSAATRSPNLAGQAALEESHTVKTLPLRKTTTTAIPPSSTSHARKGPTAMQQAISLTRQRDLPPKPREEEEKHLRELETMYKASKAAEKVKAEERGRRERERQSALAKALPLWETHMSPNWEDAAQSKVLRKLWWEGTMPVKYRGKLWMQAVGNGLSVSKNVYFKVEVYVAKLIREGTFPKEVLESIENDASSTMPLLKLFHQGGVMHDDLVDLLRAYSVYWTKEPVFYPGLAHPAALLLINMSKVDAFRTLLNLVNKSLLGSFYHKRTAEMDAYYRVFETLLADSMPRVYTNFCQENVRPELYLKPWLLTVFIRFLSIDAATRVFDVFLLEGDSFLFRVALSLLEILEPRLFNPEVTELAHVFNGTDRGSVSIVKREKNSSITSTASLAPYRKTLPDTVLPEETYEEMGCTEDAIFDRLNRAEWKESKWDRLVARELPEV